MKEWVNGEWENDELVNDEWEKGIPINDILRAKANYIIASNLLTSPLPVLFACR
jgi:hypothetical protein